MKRLMLCLGLLFAVGCADDLTTPSNVDTRELSLIAGVDRPDVRFWLTLLHNNDGESDLIDLGSGLEDFGGVARFATKVHELRRAGFKCGFLHKDPRGPRRGDDDGGEGPSTAPSAVSDPNAHAKRSRFRRKLPAPPCGVLMVSSGDNFLASPEFNASLQKGIPYYDAIAMDLIRYHAIAIGNHEFDFGPDVLADFIESFSKTIPPPPFLSSNLDFSAEPRLQALVEDHRIAKSRLIRRHGNQFGIIGATTTNLRSISSPRDVGIIDDVAAAVQAQVDALEARGATIIIFISHLQDIDADLALLGTLRGIDVAVAGGGDELLANDGDLLIPGDEGAVFGPYPMFAEDLDGVQVPVVTTAGSYGYVGRLRVGFDRAGSVVALDESSGPVRVAGGDTPDAVEPDPDVQAQVVDPVAAAVADLASNVIATSEVALDGVRDNVRSVETNEGNLIADALLWQAEQLAADFGVGAPHVALQNGGGIRNDNVLPAGDITELNTFEMVPFPNFVSVVPNISRAQFKEILENAVSRTQAGDEPGGTGRFAQIAGFSFIYDPAGTAQSVDDDGNVLTAGTRIQEVTLDDGTSIVSGGGVVDGDDLNIATIDFLARGGDQYPFRGADFTTLGVTYQQALANYIVEALGGVISAADYPEGGEGRITP